MIDEINIDQFLNKVDPANIRVYQPTSLFLVCGGKRDSSAQAPTSLREAYLRVCFSGPLSKHSPLLAEDLTQLFEAGGYQDFLTLESDIAQISSLVVLFSESYGSAAELGAFSIVPEIAEKLFAVIDDKRFSENSFIKLGPLQSLQRTHGETSVCVLNRKDVDIEDIRHLGGIKMDVFRDIMATCIEERLATVKDHTTFNPANRGHIIKLIVGIIQWYGALTLDEIDVCLMYFDLSVDRDTIKNFLLCAQFVGWISRDKRGTRTYFAAVAAKMAVHFDFGSYKVNRIRWQSEVREIWKTKDPLRFSSIVDAQARGTHG